MEGFCSMTSVFFLLAPNVPPYPPGILTKIPNSGLSLRAAGRGFSLATKRVAPGYFYWKIEEK